MSTEGNPRPTGPTSTLPRVPGVCTDLARIHSSSPDTYNCANLAPPLASRRHLCDRHRRDLSRRRLHQMRWAQFRPGMGIPVVTCAARKRHSP